METEPELADAFLNRLFALLNWTLTEFTISSQVSHTLCQPFVILNALSQTTRMLAAPCLCDWM